MSNVDLKKQGTTIVGAFVRSQILILELIAFGFLLYLIQHKNVDTQIIIAALLLCTFAFTVVTGRGLPHFRHRGKAALFLLVAGFFCLQGGYVFNQQREERWATLRQTDPDTFLSELAEFDDDRWLTELRELRPDEYQGEIRRREAELQAQREAELLAQREAEATEAARRAEQIAAEQREADARAAAAQRLIARSDDLDEYREVFTRSAAELLATGTCTEAEFIENGGWVRSTAFTSSPTYFMYCGGSTVEHRLYLDTSTGDVFRGTEGQRHIISDNGETEHLAECTDRRTALAYVMIQADVRRSLVAPSTAEFPARYGAGTRHIGNCVYQVNGYFDAQNGFGVMLRGNFSGTIEHSPDSGSWRTLTLDVQG